MKKSCRFASSGLVSSMGEDFSPHRTHIVCTENAMKVSIVDASSSLRRIRIKTVTTFKLYGSRDGWIDRPIELKHLRKFQLGLRWSPVFSMEIVFFFRRSVLWNVQTHHHITTSNECFAAVITWKESFCAMRSQMYLQKNNLHIQNNMNLFHWQHSN